MNGLASCTVRCMPTRLPTRNMARTNVLRWLTCTPACGQRHAWQVSASRPRLGSLRVARCSIFSSAPCARHEPTPAELWLFSNAKTRFEQRFSSVFLFGCPRKDPCSRAKLLVSALTLTSCPTTPLMQSANPRSSGVQQATHAARCHRDVQICPSSQPEAYRICSQSKQTPDEPPQTSISSLSHILNAH